MRQERIETSQCHNLQLPTNGSAAEPQGPVATTMNETGKHRSMASMNILSQREIMRKRIHSFFSAFLLALFLFVSFNCSGESSISSNNTDDSDQSSMHTFNLSATVGEFLTYTIDTANLTYSYTVVESEFGLEGTSGNGLLVRNQDGTYSPALDPHFYVVLLSNTLLVGIMDIAINETDTTMLFAGVPAFDSLYTVSQITGVYNFISYTCDNSLDNGVCPDNLYTSYPGTFRVNTDGTADICIEGDLDNIDIAPCSDGGALYYWTDNGDGTLLVTDESPEGRHIGTAMLLPSAKGGKVLIVDLKDTVSPDRGPGLLAGVKKQDISALDLSGEYRIIGDDGGYAAITVDSEDLVTGTYKDPEGIESPVNTSLTRNIPWNGWVTDSDGNHVLILPEDGAFFTFHPEDNDYIQIGGRIE